MAQGATLQVKGYRELLRAFQTADRDSRRELRAAFREVGDVVRRDAVRRLAVVDSRSAAGYRTRVRQRGVAVEQSRRKTTGHHPEWGAYQMRNALLPALNANEDETERAMERAMDHVAAHFNRGTL